MIDKDNSSNGGGTLVPLNTWLTQIRVTPVTAWRWRRKGWLKTVNILGRVYLTEKAIVEFQQRAEAGEFAKARTTTQRGVA
jgi:predicted site-specific integrase-resolvase